MNPRRRHPSLSLVFLAVLAILLTTTTAPLGAQGCVNTQCDTMGMCTLTATAPQLMTTVMSYSVFCTFIVYGAGFNGMGAASNAACNPGVGDGSVFDFMHPFSIQLMGTGTGANPLCSWDAVVGFCAGGVTNFNCSVDAGDGLPVELMDFFVDSGEE